MSTRATPLPRRLAPEESRTAALDAARALLIEAGPQGVTLKAVAARVGRTHANLLHHFGSAAGLQRALAERMAADITATIGEAVLAARAGTRDPRAIVDLTFDAFDREGAGALASWMILSGHHDALDPILQAIHRLVDQLAAGTGIGARPIAEETLQLVLLALGDALLGGPMAGALGLPRTRARELALAGLLGSAAIRE
ncbi:TetR family transcriptional regulator [Sphingomonas sp. KR1UV-12]|uniref:TetR family transcriptional regulator n=1 Tax=Sphingomonas aurea TaxID=3063994 RepID=A0ABT9EFN9_9SPHN|nr:TetR family transcriptional regulator [Sphingomonas sp. KR1UV-12]MDP1025781.1 TetR family transcriptional regulator [Sphingomonas sp. KR1UV-12]